MQQRARKAPKARKAVKTAKRSLTTKKVVKKTAKKINNKSTKSAAVTTQHRASHVNKDKQGRELPIDYDQQHFHDPYDYLKPGHSSIFDENILIREKEAQQYFGEDNGALDHKVNFASPEFKKGVKHMNNIIQSWKDETKKFGDSITDAKEKEAYDNTFGYLAKPTATSDEEEKLLAQDLGLKSVDSLHMEQLTTSWSGTLMHDITYGTPEEKARYIAAVAIAVTATGSLAYGAVDACIQYFYDIEYPLHGDHH